MARNDLAHPLQTLHPDDAEMPADARRQTPNRNVELHLAAGSPARSQMSSTNDKAWNDAYDRLVLYLRTYDLADHAHVARVALDILQQAKDAHAKDPSREPTALTLGLAQKKISEWLAHNMPQ